MDQDEWAVLSQSFAYQAHGLMPGFDGSSGNTPAPSFQLSSASTSSGVLAPTSASASAPASRSRPCDTCRLRKTRCVREDGQSRCVLCTFHGQQCTFLRGPLPRQRRVNREKNAQAREGAETSWTGQKRYSGDLTGLADNRTTDQGQSPTLDRNDLLMSSPSDLGEPQSSQPSLSGQQADIFEHGRPAILNDTLGLDLATHAEYIGPTDYRDPVLLDLHRPRPHPTPDTISGPPSLFARRLDDRTIFLVHPDESAASEAQKIADLDAIEATVHPLGRTLVDLYFRVVHPSFPILHKDVFIQKHRVSHHHFAPSLLAAVYLMALDWQLYDSFLAGREKDLPDAAALEELAERSMAQDMRRPKLGILQAGLLLLQRSRRIVESGSNKNTTSSHTFTAQMVAMAQDLGLHVDCSTWSIPRWEVGLRRRLAWALYSQDRWGAFVHGRPFLIHESDWDVRPCNTGDFPELTESEDPNSEGSITAQLGWELFLRHIELAQILTYIIRTFYSTAATRSGGTLDQMGTIAAVELAKPMVLRLREWHTNLPENLTLQSNQLQKLCANGSLHLAHSATEIAIHRALVRILTPNTPEQLHNAIRSTARAKLRTATEMLGSLRPEHTAAFWGSAAAYQAAQIGSLAALLWATAETADEVAWCAARVDELRWALRVRGAAAPFAREALRLLEREIGGLGVVRANNDEAS